MKLADREVVIVCLFIEYAKILVQMSEQVKDLETSSGEKQDTLRLRKTTLDLLPDAANNISRLEVCCEPQLWKAVESYF